MSDANTVLERFERASHAWGQDCQKDPSVWHRPDVAEFSKLRTLLEPHAESGHAGCQYALATISWLGLCRDSEELMLSGHEAAIREATRWWIAASSQGYWPALDNLIVLGVGPEADRARIASDEVARDRADLIGRSHGMPVYGPDFIQEVGRRIYGWPTGNTEDVRPDT